MATANIYDLADTWNDAGTTFTAIKMDVTDTASASGSLLMDLQVGTSSKFSVNKTGEFVATTGINGSCRINGNGNGVIVSAFGTDAVAYGPYGPRLGVDTTLSWGSTTNGPGSADTILTRKAAANLRLGAADNATSIVAQTLSVQSVASGGLTPNIAGEDFTIQGSAGTGSGAGGSIIFQVAPAGGSGTGQNTLVDALTIAPITGGGSLTLAGDSSSSTLTPFAAGINGIHINNKIMLGGTTSGDYSTYLASDCALGWSSSTSVAASISDTRLYRDAADTLALRRGANAQEFRVYKTETGTVYKALLGDNNLIKISGEAFTDGAGASTGTLTNAPAAGNPTKWIPIDDNGTTRYIPAW